MTASPVRWIDEPAVEPGDPVLPDRTSHYCTPPPSRPDDWYSYAEPDDAKEPT